MDPNKLEGPPTYRPSIDKIFLDKLSESDRYLVTKLDMIDQRIEWVILVAIANHNQTLKMMEQISAFETRLDALEGKIDGVALPDEDKSLLKWIRTHAVGPTKLIGWIIALGVGAALTALADNLFSKN